MEPICVPRSFVSFPRRLKCCLLPFLDTFAFQGSHSSRQSKFPDVSLISKQLSLTFSFSDGSWFSLAQTDTFELFWVYTKALGTASLWSDVCAVFIVPAVWTHLQFKHKGHEPNFVAVAPASFESGFLADSSKLSSFLLPFVPVFLHFRDKTRISLSFELPRFYRKSHKNFNQNKRFKRFQQLWFFHRSAQWRPGQTLNPWQLETAYWEERLMASFVGEMTPWVQILWPHVLWWMGSLVLLMWLVGAWFSGEASWDTNGGAKCLMKME